MYSVDPSSVPEVTMAVLEARHGGAVSPGREDESFRQYVRFQQLRPRGYHAHVKIAFSRGRFLVKTLDCWDELRQAFHLRHEIFHTEHHGRVLPTRLDIDETDFACDHLGIFDGSKLIGVYRLVSTRFSDAFYAKTKFDLDAFLALAGEKLELGRACVDRDHRNGVTLQLLWRGIFEYLRATQTRYLFGSASVRTLEPREIGRIHGELKTYGAVDERFGVSVRPEYQVPAFIDEPNAGTPLAALDIPALFQSYLRAGAKVAAPPALDTYLRCVDFLTVLDVGEMTERLQRRYRG